jgi:hypothetical protein
MELRLLLPLFFLLLALPAWSGSKYFIRNAKELSAVVNEENVEEMVAFKPLTKFLLLRDRSVVPPSNNAARFGNNTQINHEFVMDEEEYRLAGFSSDIVSFPISSYPPEVRELLEGKLLAYLQSLPAPNLNEKPVGQQNILSPTTSVSLDSIYTRTSGNSCGEDMRRKRIQSVQAAVEE